MTIINANYYLEQLLAPAALERIARLCKFCLRQRAITPAMLVPALLRAMGGDQVNDIAGLHRHFNALQLVNTHQVSYKPFHNQLRKESFALFMKALVERAIALRIDHQLKAASLGAFKQVLLHDGTSFAVHRRLAADFPGRFKTISPAAIECHMTMSLSEQSPLCMSVSADTAGERQFLPEAHTLTNCLLLADAGYIDRAWFEQVNDAGGFYLVRGTKSLNPKIIQAWRGDGREVPKLAGLSLREAGRRRCRAEVLDMVVKSGQVEYRLIRRWFAEESLKKPRFRYSFGWFSLVVAAFMPVALASVSKSENTHASPCNTNSLMLFGLYVLPTSWRIRRIVSWSIKPIKSKRKPSTKYSVTK